MSPAITRKRLVTGVVCPVCSEQDKIQMWEEDGVSYHECVTCGYVDTSNAQDQSVPRKLGTRVNQDASKPANPKMQPAQFSPDPRLEERPNA